MKKQCSGWPVGGTRGYHRIEMKPPGDRPMPQKMKCSSLFLALSVCMITVGCSKSVEEGAPQPVGGLPESSSSQSPSTSTTASTPQPGMPVANADPNTSIFLGLTTTKPEGWEPAVLESGMEKARYLVPAAEGEEQASVVVFSIGGGGEVQANIDRWAGQVTKPDGSPGEPKVEEFMVGDMKVSLVELLGTYQGMGMPAALPDQLFLSAIIDTSSGRIFIRLVGSQRTVEANREDYMAFLKGLKPVS